MTKVPALPVIPKPVDRWWTVINRYFADGEKVVFSQYRALKYTPEIEGTIVRGFRQQEFGRVNYDIQLKNGDIVKGVMLEDIKGGDWYHHQGNYSEKNYKGRSQLESYEKTYNIAYRFREDGTVERRWNNTGFSTEELIGIFEMLRDRYIDYSKTVQPIHCCSFCGKEPTDDNQLISSGFVFVCSNCIGICNEILSGTKTTDSKQTKKKKARSVEEQS